MIRTAFGVAFLWIVSLSLVVQGAPGTRGASERPAAGTPAGQKVDLPPRTPAENRWRYSFRNGHWWYYRDGGRWAYWTGALWRDYEPGSYRRWLINQQLAEYNAELARFDARALGPYMDDRFHSFSPGFPGGAFPGGLAQQPSFAAPALPRGGDYGGSSFGVFSPRPFDGRLNPATSTGGYMGSALRAPLD